MGGYLVETTKGKKYGEDTCVGMRLPPEYYDTDGHIKIITRLPPEYYGPEGMELVNAYWKYEEERSNILHDKMDAVIKELKTMVTSSGQPKGETSGDMAVADASGSPLEEGKDAHKLLRKL
jgi:hypothetical protein